MGIQLTRCIVSGEIDNSTLNTVHGKLGSRCSPSAGSEPTDGAPNSVIDLSLAGNLSGSLAGKHVVFRSTASERRPSMAETGEVLFSPQIGVVGSSELRSTEIPSIAGGTEGLPTNGPQAFFPDLQKHSLHLDWYGQNGFVVAIAVNAELTFVVDKPDCSPAGEYPTDAEHLSGADSPRTSIPIPPMVVATVPESWRNGVRGTDRSLIPEELQLPDPNSVTDEESAWEGLQLILSQLALMNIAFDICPHFTGREAYSLLTDTIFRTVTLHANLSATGFIQHLASHEHCERCKAEFQRQRKYLISRKSF